MCLSSAQILSAWILNPESLPASYISFLNKHGGKDNLVVRCIRDMAFGNYSTDLEKIEKCYRPIGVGFQHMPGMRILCKIIHGNDGCISHFFRFLAEAYIRALEVYIPVYLIPAIIVHRQALLQKNNDSLLKTALGTARSSLFLSVYCASTWLWTCALCRVIGKCSCPVVALATFPSGLAVMIEKKSRRMEIALYCFARALESFAICIPSLGGKSQKPYTKQMNFIDAFLFSIATGIIMHCYSQEREVFQSRYLNVLDWVFGIPHDGPPLIKPLISMPSIYYLLGCIGQGRLHFYHMKK
eukprot:c22767_g1_i1 orf=1055-1951(+)